MSLNSIFLRVRNEYLNKIIEIGLNNDKSDSYYTGERFEGVKQSLNDKYNSFKAEMDGMLQKLN